MDIIEILDDLEYERARPRKRQKVAPSSKDEVIELYDSDDEPPPPSQFSSFSGPSRSQPQAHNRPHQKPLPLFLEDFDELPLAGPSGAALDHIPERSRPAIEAPPLRREPSVILPPPTTQDVPVVSRDPDPLTGYVAQVLEIVPDVDPNYVLELVMRYLPDYQDKVVEPVLHTLFEDPSYPKVGKGKGKRKRDEEDEDEEPSTSRPAAQDKGKEKDTINYLDKNRHPTGGVHYLALAVDQLSVDFPLIPMTYIRQTFIQERRLYAPAYFRLVEDQKLSPSPFKPIASSRHKDKRSKGKGVARVDEEFNKEREWLLQRLKSDKEVKDAEVAEQLRDQECIETEGGIECGCCFSEYPFDKMVQCPEAHLFCVSCMIQYAETLLGSHDPKIVCMDQSGCKLLFPESELRRFLSPKLVALYERVKQQKEIEAAGLEGLEECPFCEYKVVIENDQEKLFRCENAECGAVSCRACKKLDHLPKSCKEIDDDKKLDGRHAIEEAMTRALMRNCPKCQKAFVKETGCNKMTCPHCHTFSCYVCRKVIDGYQHFNQQPPNSRGPIRPQDAGKCLLWDSVEERHADEVTAAAKQAIEQYKREHPDVDDKDIQVDLPKTPAAGSSNPRALHPPLQGPIPLHPFPARQGPPYVPPMAHQLQLHENFINQVGARLNNLRALVPQVHVVHHAPQNPVFNVHVNFPQGMVPPNHQPQHQQLLPPHQQVQPQPPPLPRIIHYAPPQGIPPAPLPHARRKRRR